MNNPSERSLTGPEEWDSVIDNAFNMGPFSRTLKADDWWVITGMHVKLPDALAGRPAGTNKLLVCADTISVGKPGATQMNWNGWSDVLLIGASVNQYNGCTFHRDLVDNSDKFRVAVCGQTSEHFSPSDSRWVVTAKYESSGTDSFDMGDGRGPIQTEVYRWYTARVYKTSARQLPLPSSGPGFDGCRTFLARLLLAVQSLFNAKRTADAYRLLERLESILAMNPGVASWQEIAAQCAVTREMLQSQLPGSDRVPYLSPDVYGGVAGAYGPALKAFADTFQQSINRSIDVEQRKRAAQLIIDERADAIKFQALVNKQLTDNFDAATNNATKAQTSMESQRGRVEAAERTFQSGLAAWRKEQERQAAMAIAGAAFSFVSSCASMFAGNPAGAAGAAEAVAKAATTAQKLADLMKKLAKLVELVAKLVKMCKDIADAAGKISNAKEFADRMTNVRREAESGGLADAPSASAYWDQLWLEVELVLAPAINEKVGGAAEYLKELKVLVIYGRALTSAQAAIPPIVQEMARASLLAEVAKRQYEAVAKEIDTLQAGQATPALAAMSLWLRHRSVQRAMLTALQHFDAAHRYWALTDEQPQRDPSRSITDLAGDLLEVADIKARLQRALESFNPKPQDFKRVAFNVPPAAIADLLRDGSFSLRFTPDFGPFNGWGRVGRVRVDEVAVWVNWEKDKRPNDGDMEFTIRTDGDYYDQRVQLNQVKQFRFNGAQVNLTFRYDPVEADRAGREQSINIRAKVAEDFRAFYTEPTMFTEWQFSLPKGGGGAINREALQGAVSGIRLEFSGKYIKDPDRFV